MAFREGGTHRGQLEGGVLLLRAAVVELRLSTALRCVEQLEELSIVHLFD